MLRHATEEDAALLFAWANDPATRRASLSTKEIEWPAHVAWLESRLADESCATYVVADADGEVAGVRFDDVGDGGARVSVVVAPSCRGRGLAAVVIEAAVERYVSDRPMCESIVAEVRSFNVRSHAAFSRCGFESHGVRQSTDGERVDVLVRRLPSVRPR